MAAASATIANVIVCSDGAMPAPLQTRARCQSTPRHAWLSTRKERVLAALGTAQS
jgi:hypothetical protein